MPRAPASAHQRAMAVLVLLLLVTIKQTQAINHYVSTQTGTDGPTCGAVTSPCKTIVSAINNAESGDSILLYTGDYKGFGNHNLEVRSKSLTFDRATTFSKPKLVYTGTRMVQIRANYQGETNEGDTSGLTSFRNIIFDGNLFADPAFGNTAGNALWIRENANVSFVGCTFQRWRQHQSAGAALGYFWDSAYIRFTDCHFEDIQNNNGYTPGTNGVIYANKVKQLIFEGCTFKNMRGAKARGGLLYAYTPVETRFEHKVLFRDCFIDDVSSDAPAAVYGIYVHVDIQNTVFTNCKGTDFGGIIYTVGARFVLNDTLFTANVNGYGSITGGLDGEFYCNNCTFRSNILTHHTSSANSGGGLIQHASTSFAKYVVHNSEFVDNRGFSGVVYYAFHPCYLEMVNVSMVNSLATAGATSGATMNFANDNDVLLRNIYVDGNRFVDTSRCGQFMNCGSSRVVLDGSNTFGQSQFSITSNCNVTGPGSADFFRPTVLDECNICSGDNSTCKGCDGVPNSGKTINPCGVCGQPNADRQATVVAGTFAANASAGSVATLLVQAKYSCGVNRTLGGDDFRLATTGPTLLGLPTVLPHQVRGLYALNISTTVAGAYTLNLYVGTNTATTLASSPYIFRVFPLVEPSLARSNAVMSANTVKAGMWATVRIQLADAYGNNLTHSQAHLALLSLQISPATATASEQRSMVQSDTGLYQLSINITTTTSVNVTAFFNGTQVGDALPLSVVAAEQSVAHCIAVEGPATSSIPANVTAELRILSRDRFGNPAAAAGSVDVQATGAASVSATATPDPNSATAYAVAMSYPQPGIYQVAVSKSGVHIAGSPFPVTVLGAANLTSIQPALGPHTGGTRVTITGTGLFNDTTGVQGCLFSSHPTVLVPGTAQSATQMVCIAPAASAGVHTVRVTNNNGTSLSPAANFSVFTAPSVSSVSPSEGPVYGGFEVTVTGSAFQDTGSVRVQIGTQIVSATVSSSTQLVFVAPVSPQGSFAVEVSLNGQQYTGDAKLIRFLKPFSEYCRNNDQQLPFQADERAEKKVTFYPNLALVGASADLSDGGVGEGTNKTQLIDGDRCCREGAYRCGIRFNRTQSGDSSLPQATVVLARPAFITEVLTSWYSPCRNLPRPFYNLRVWDEGTQSWTALLTHVTEAGVLGVQKPCSVVPSDSGEVALCIDLLETPVHTQRLRVEFNNSVANMGSSTDGGWLFELETHGVFADRAVHLSAEGPVTEGVSVPSSTHMLLPVASLYTLDLKRNKLLSNESAPTNVTVQLLATKSKAKMVLGGTTTVASANGVANFTTVHAANLTSGTYTLLFDAPGLSTTTVLFSVVPGPATALSMAAVAATGASGMFPCQSVIITIPWVDLTVRDAGGNAVAATDPTRTVQASLYRTSVGSTSLASTSTSISGGSGRLEAWNVPGQGKGDFVVRFRSAGLAEATWAIQFAAGAPYRVAVMANNVTDVNTQRRVPLGPVTFAIEDACGNRYDPVYATAGTTSFSVSVATVNDSLGVVPPTPVVITSPTQVGGWSNLAELTSPTSGHYVLELRSAGLQPAAIPVTVLPGEPVHLAQDGVFVSTPLATLKRLPLPVLRVQALDAGNTPTGAIDTAVRNITVRGINVQLEQDEYNATMVNGTASIAGMAMLAPVVGTRILNVSSPGLTTVSVSVQISTGPVAKLSLVLPTQDGIDVQTDATVRIGTIIVVSADAGGTVLGALDNQARNITVHLPVGIQHEGTTRALMTHGYVNFTDIALLSPPSKTYAISVSDDNGLLESTSYPLRVSFGPLNKLQIQTAAAITVHSVSNTAIARTLVWGVDAGGTFIGNLDIVPRNVTASLRAINASNSNAALSGTTQRALNESQVEFGDLVLPNPRAGVYEISFASGTLTAAVLQIRVVPGPASQLQLYNTSHLQPVRVSASTRLPEFYVHALDAGGNFECLGNCETDRSVFVTVLPLAQPSAPVPTLAGSVQGVMHLRRTEFDGLQLVRPTAATHTLHFSCVPALTPTTYAMSVVVGVTTQLKPRDSFPNLDLVAAPSIGLPDLEFWALDAGSNRVTDASLYMFAWTMLQGDLVAGERNVSVQASAMRFTGLRVSGKAGVREYVVEAGGASNAVQPARFSVHVRAGAAVAMEVTRNMSLVSDNQNPLAQQPVLIVVDQVGNLVNASNGVEVSVQVVPVDSGSAVPVLSGDTSTSSAGVISFAAFQVVGTRGGTYRVRFSAPNLATLDYAGVLQIVSCPDNEAADATSGTTCLCLAGYTRNTGSGACEPCPRNTYKEALGDTACQGCPANTGTQQIASSSVDNCACVQGFFASPNDRFVCRTCISGATCEGGSSIVAQPGHWSAGGNTLTFYTCPNKEACRGGNSSACATGYRGPLCAVCDKGYGKFGVRCEPCGEPGVNWFVLILSVVVLLLVLATLARRSRHRKRSQNATIKRIFLNYLQVIAFVGDFAVRWSSLIQEFFNFIGITSVEIASYPLQCSLEPTYYQNLALYLYIPVVAVGVPLVLFYTAKLVQELRGQTLRPGMGTLAIRLTLVTLFLFHPAISKKVFSVFNCRDFGNGQVFLVSDYRVSCNTDEYRRWAGGMVFFAIMYCFGLPLLTLVYLTRQFRADKLWLQSTQRRVHFLTDGLRPSRFYWEVLIMLRKLIIVVVIVVYKEQALTQLYLGAWVLLASLVFHLIADPFEDALASRCELGALVATCVTLLSGMLYFSDIAEADLYALSAFLITFNALVVGVFLYLIFKFFLQKRKVQILAHWGPEGKNPKAWVQQTMDFWSDLQGSAVFAYVRLLNPAFKSSPARYTEEEIRELRDQWDILENKQQQQAPSASGSLDVMGSYKTRDDLARERKQEEDKERLELAIMEKKMEEEEERERREKMERASSVLRAKSVKAQRNRGVRASVDSVGSNSSA